MPRKTTIHFLRLVAGSIAKRHAFTVFHRLFNNLFVLLHGAIHLLRVASKAFVRNYTASQQTYISEALHHTVVSVRNHPIPTIFNMKRQIQWTQDMRTVLMLLRTQTTFRADSDKVAAVFNHIFATQLIEAGYTGGMPVKRILDSWNSRKSPGRSQKWVSVEGPPKDAEERQYRQRLLHDIWRAEAEMEGRGFEGNDERVKSEEENMESKYGNQVNGQLFTTTQRTGNEPLSSHIFSNQAINEQLTRTTFRGTEFTDIQRGNTYNHAPQATATGQTSTRAFQEVMSQASTPTESTTVIPPLQMIHSIDKPNVYSTFLSSTGFISEDEAIFHVGGRVYNVLVDGSYQDVMVCNRELCNKCNNKSIAPGLLGEAIKQTQGLPFVHAKDIHVANFRVSKKARYGEDNNNIEHVEGTEVCRGFQFTDQYRDYDNKYPKHIWKTRVTFSDGVRREVMACVGARCEYCTSRSEIEKKAARYQPGREFLHDIHVIVLMTHQGAIYTDSSRSRRGPGNRSNGVTVIELWAMHA